MAEQQDAENGNLAFTLGEAKLLAADPRIQPGETGTSSGRVEVGRIAFSDELFNLAYPNARDPELLKRLIKLEMLVMQQANVIMRLDGLMDVLLAERQTRK